MAIQLRRGAYGDFDETKLVAGEGAVVLEDDPNTTDGKALYICFATGSAKRMATFEDMNDIADALNDEFQREVGGAVSAAHAFISAAQVEENGRQTAETAREDAEDDRVAAEQMRESDEIQRQTNETLRQAAETAREDAEAERVAAERARVVAESLRATAETGREQEEARRTARFAEMELRSKGWLRHYCVAGEYDPTTGVPTVSDPNSATLYFVPMSDSGAENKWVEWIVDDEDSDNLRWEKMGTVDFELDPIEATQIDNVLDDVSETGTQVLTLTGLTYFWAAIKAAFTNLFAPLNHTHATATATSDGFMSADDKAKLNRLHNTVTWGDFINTTTWGELKGQS